MEEMGYRKVLFPKTSSATHDAFVAHLARDRSLLLDVLRQAWPQAFDGVGDPRIATLRIEHPVVVGRNGRDGRRSSGWVAGFIDLVVVVEVTRQHGSAVRYQEVFCVEVKSGQIAFGDLMRQINFYRAHQRARRKDGYWVVVGPDDRYADLLKSQDVAFVRMMPPVGQTAVQGVRDT